MKTMYLKIVALSLLTSLAIAQQNPPPIRRSLPPISISPMNDTSWSQRESLVQQQISQMLLGQGQILPIRATLGLQHGQVVKKVIVIAMSRAGHGRLEVLADGRPLLIASDGMQSYEKIVGTSLEVIEAEVNLQIGSSMQTLQLRTDGQILISLLGATVQNQITPPPIPVPIPPRPIPPRPFPQPVPQPLPLPSFIVCANDALNVYQATFQRVKNFAYSTSGLDMTEAQSTQFAIDYTNHNACDEADGYMRRISSLREFAYSTAGLDMTSAQARQFAIENENKVCILDNSFVGEFKQLYNFAYSTSGLNMTSAQARNYAWEKIQSKYFSCAR
ncbi:MAG: hypothetical protein A4S09_03185 [Proteobacteria bacterium SG_bin7]|nr:MAG: hypothetical protein A4S09_03185 [Proteobacteria bacterium SG_bin7]